jgi:hypothetical protein
MQKTAVLILPLFLASCTGGEATAAAGAKNPAMAQSPKALPSDLASPSDPRATGTVEETLDAGGYTYVRLKTAGGDLWAAVSQAALTKGSEITIGDAMWMENFESKTLKRKFDRILFGAVVANGSNGALPPGHPPTGEADAPKGLRAGVPATAGDIPGVAKVDRAPGGKTVAEIFAGKAMLKGAEVTVRGQVVKFNPGILGRNWIHLRDGSGSADKQDHDITVTTTDMVTKGEVVTIHGKVALDQDFTAGYAYPVMIEGAKVVR